MSSAWIAYMLLTGTIVAVAVLAVDAACRLAGWQRRWAPFGGLLMIIALAIFAPESTPPISPVVQFDLSSFPVTEIASPIAAAPAQVASPFSDAVRTVASATETLPQIVANMLPSRFEPWYNGAWVAASAVLFLLFLLVHVRFLRARRGWPVFNLLGTNVRLSQAAGPAVVGAFRPDIVIPRWLLQRERDQQQLVLEHEREHVCARDPLMLVSAWTCALAMPWHPAVWWMLWKLRLAVELDCDARVLARGTPRRSYGALLIELSQQSAGLPIGATALSDRTTHLERRLLAMNTHRPSFFRLRSTAFALLAIVMIVSACALRKPARNVEEPPASPAMPATVAAPPILTTTAPTVQPPVAPLPASATVAPQTSAAPTPMAQIGHFTRPLIIIDGVIQMQDDPTIGQPPVPQAAPQQTRADSMPRPVIIIDGVIQNPNDPYLGRFNFPPFAPATTPPPRVDTATPVPPLRQMGYTRPLIIIDGVIQMQDDSTLRAPLPRGAPTTVPPARTDTASRTAPPPVPPVRPRVDTVPVAAPQAEAPIRLSQQQLGRLIIVVDGRIVQDTSAVMRNLTGSDIASVEIIRGLEAVAQFGERGREGVLNIRTIASTNPGARSGLGGRGGGAGGRGSGDSTFMGSGSDVVIQLRNPLRVAGPPPMVIIDGVIQTGNAEDVAKLFPDSSKIKSIEIVRGAAAVSLYGDRALNGVINIVTKR